MAGRSPAGPLMAEHRVIERMVTVLESEIDSISKGESVDSRRLDKVIDFIRMYADRCHHGKEEDILFDRLTDKNLDPALEALMQELVDEHVKARGFTRRLIDANDRYARGDTDASSEIVQAGGELVRLYPSHIAKEDRRFFKPCLEYFTDEERAQMLADFEEFDRTLVHEKYKKLVEELESEQR